MNVQHTALDMPWIVQEIDWISEDLRSSVSDQELAAYRRLLLLEFRARCVTARLAPQGFHDARSLHVRLKHADQERRHRLLDCENLWGAPISDESAPRITVGA